jgi:hypothetical protein
MMSSTLISLWITCQTFYAGSCYTATPHQLNAAHLPKLNSCLTRIEQVAMKRKHVTPIPSNSAILDGGIYGQTTASRGRAASR